MHSIFFEYISLAVHELFHRVLKRDHLNKMHLQLCKLTMLLNLTKIIDIQYPHKISDHLVILHKSVCILDLDETDMYEKTVCSFTKFLLSWKKNVLPVKEIPKYRLIASFRLESGGF